ncbi:MAG: peptide chain release factor N(5)-glutamine methyltransferase [Bacteroidetes bacterium]|nr:peptide chain release factor N(5)-glutamine methyltransferase [Bacteroidota bacterium]
MKTRNSPSSGEHGSDNSRIPTEDSVVRLDDVVRHSVERLRTSGNDEARREVEWMLESLMGIRRMQLLMQQGEPVSKETQARLHECVERRIAREPLQYILGEAHFYGHRFTVSPSVLIPRPETELLAEWAIQQVSGLKGGKLLDLGTGSGCLPITVSLDCPDAECVGVDISAEALEVARMNARNLGAKVVFVEGDMISLRLESALASRFDVLISNPPYIPEGEREELQSEVIEHEPQIALFAGTDPLHFYRGIAAAAPSLLKSKGRLCVEIHSWYGNDVLELFHAAGFREVRLQKDLAGRDRLISARMI